MVRPNLIAEVVKYENQTKQEQNLNTVNQTWVFRVDERPIDDFSISGQEGTFSLS